MHKRYFFDKPGNVKRVLYTFYAIAAALFLSEFVFERHADHALEEFWGFYAIYGFVACVTLVLVAKQMRKLLGRRENFYER